MTNIKVTDLDFFEIKENLKNFLKQQNEFKDYDFEGSGLQVLLDLLASNTYYNSIYQNMVMNESFLDTAILRESVVSRAKVLGYTPRSYKSSQATVTLNLKEDVSQNSSPNQPEYIILPEYKKFISREGNSSYVFTNTESVFLSSNSEYTDNNGNTRKLYSATFDIVQGIRNQQSFTVDYENNPDQRFIIPNENVDVDTLSVSIKESFDSDDFIYTKAGNVSEISPDDRVYWVIENELGNYELEFGNGRIGKKLLNNSEITIEYIITEGSVCNNFKVFNWNDVLTIEDSTDPSKNSNYSLYSIQTVSQSSGGAEKETLEEIKFSAPKNYETQNRAVTSSDYRFIIENSYKFIESVKTWGGEDNDPPEYGKVFVSLKPKEGFFITNTMKDNIKNNFIKDYSVVSITPEIVDPYFTFIKLESNVKYNSGEVFYGQNYVKNLIIESLKTFDNENLKKFDSYFRFSRMVSTIDDSHSSIKSNISKISIENRLDIIQNQSNTYTTNFNNSLIAGTLQSNEFTFSGRSGCYMEDSDGKISICKIENGVKILVKNNVGLVDYVNGKITINNINISSEVDSQLKLSVIPLNFDLNPYNNQIFILNSDDIILNMENISEQFLKE